MRTRPLRLPPPPVVSVDGGRTCGWGNADEVREDLPACFLLYLCSNISPTDGLGQGPGRDGETNSTSLEDEIPRETGPRRCLSS